MQVQSIHYVHYIHRCMFFYRLVMISIDLSETTQKSTLEIRDKIQSKIKSENFFSKKKKKKLLEKNFVRKRILGFFLGLNFVSDYIPQLYFVCNHLILLISLNKLDRSSNSIGYFSKLAKFRANCHLANDWTCFEHKC